MITENKNYTMPSLSRENSLLYRMIDYSVGEEHLIQVREDFKRICYNNVKRFQQWNPSERFLKKEALSARDNALSSKWDRIGYYLGTLLTIVSILYTIPFGDAVSVIAISITILAVTRRAAVTILVYDNPYRIYHRRKLKFAYAWNRAMCGWTSFLVLPVAVLDRTTPDDYKLSLWLMEEAIEEKYG